MRLQYLFLFIFVLPLSLSAQDKQTSNGVIIGNILDQSNSKALAGASLQLTKQGDSLFNQTILAGRNGDFILSGLPFGYYSLSVSMSGYSPLRIDSIHIRSERTDFDLNDIRLSRTSSTLQEVVVYAEKPLIESKDGKLIFNTGESALSSGSTTTELLKQTPLVNVDNDGKVLMRGKEVKILIDEKPVELDAKQLQDLLESMPGSMIEKIEVMTTPPPQYANERGGVINIVTKKGRVGFSARINFSYGSRGEAGLNGNLSYRKGKLALNASGGFSYSEYRGNNYSRRQNIYTDSLNYFNTEGNNHSANRRPTTRISMDYDLNKRNSLNITAQFNSNNAHGYSTTEYSNINKDQLLYKLSSRDNRSRTMSYSPNFSFSYGYKGKDPREALKLIGSANFNANEVEKDYYQQYLNTDRSFSGNDSTQQQITTLHSNNVVLRLNYDRPLGPRKLMLNLGGIFNRLNSHNVLQTAFLHKPDNVWTANGLLSNDLRFHQTVYSLRAAIRYDIVTDFYILAGSQLEHTTTLFDIPNSANNYQHGYWSPLPFVTIMKKWANEISLTFSYKRSIQRPGFNELNPSVDFADPYNTRFGNPYLLPWYADNFDLIAGKWNKNYYYNFSAGYNNLRDIYSSIRTLQADGKTTTTWQNISGRTEYEANAWGGYTLSKKLKLNLSAGYTWHLYSLYDRQYRYYRNGGSLVSSCNGNYQFSDVMNASISLGYNRFANPQGTVNSTLSMNLGWQRKFFAKKFIVAVNIIDPFRQQQNRSYIYASNFSQESYSFTHTRNFKIVLSYVFSKKKGKDNRTELLKKIKTGK
ncbi:MAG: outer membrane beta-barrel protein [Ferruginibacter sp.]